MPLAKPKAKPSTPVPVSTPAIDCGRWCDLKENAKAIEKELKSLALRIAALIPEKQDAATYKATRRNVNGEYKVVRVTQDRRNPDPEKLLDLMKSKGLATPINMRMVPDPDRVAKLIDEGKITLEELATTLVGTQPTYCMVTFEKT
jgi:hypothetical protein